MSFIIRFDGLFERGYVSRTWIGKSKDTRFDNQSDVKKYATPHRFKWAAQLWCWLYNKLENSNYGFRKFTVEEYKPQA